MAARLDIGGGRLLEEGSSDDEVVAAPQGRLSSSSANPWKVVGITVAAGLVGTALFVAATQAPVLAPAQAVEAGRSEAVSLAEDTVMEALLSCSAPKEGSSCFRDIEYAQDHIQTHPDWYVGLNADSSFKQVQDFLHKQRDGDGLPRCPRPCGYVRKSDDAGHHAIISGKCHTAQTGEECYNHIIYTQKENLPKHPEWYPGLAQDATFKVVQDYLHQEGVCPAPCGLQEEKKRMKTLAEKKKLKEDREKHCHSAVAGEACYGDILWARDHLEKHGEWYKGLTRESSFDEIQAFLHKQHNSDPTKLCPKPCNSTANSILKHVNVDSCHTAGPGDSCFKSVLWVITEGIVKHPDWYTNLTRTATVEEVQARLVKNKDKHCKRDPCSCTTAQEGDKCFKAIKWVMKVGIANHSSWYQGLNENSTLEEVQLRLHQDKHPLCPIPCARTPWLRYDEDGKPFASPIDINGEDVEEWVFEESAEPEEVV